AAGLGTAVDALRAMRFSARTVAALRRLPALRDQPGAFFDRLRRFRFACDVWAIPEGAPFFAAEPIVRVTGPVLAAPAVEPLLLTLVGLEAAIASKAARLAIAAQGRPVIELGLRRAHGPHAGLLGVRAATIGGCAGTSHVLAALRLGVPAFGTMAHSW